MSSIENETFEQLKLENQMIQTISAGDARFFQLKELQRKINALPADALTSSERSRLLQDITMTEGQLKMAIGSEQFNALAAVEQPLRELKTLLSSVNSTSLPETQVAADRLEEAMKNLNDFQSPTAFSCLQEARRRLTPDAATEKQEKELDLSNLQQKITLPNPMAFSDHPTTPVFTAGEAQKTIPVPQNVPKKNISICTVQQGTWGGNKVMDEPPIPRLKVEESPQPEPEIETVPPPPPFKTELESVAIEDSDKDDLLQFEMPQFSSCNYLLFFLSSLLFGAFGINFFLIHRYKFGLLLLFVSIAGGTHTVFFCYSISLFVAYLTTLDGKGKPLNMRSSDLKHIRFWLLIIALLGLLVAISRLLQAMH